MANVATDIFIIGGGINGAGIALDAAGRGLSVTLVEKNDLASGTSSMSSKLIHGGLRYLATYDFSLVRKALQEREILQHIAPHLITPLEFILPQATHARPDWLIRMGLFIYDHLASHPLLPNSKKISLEQTAQGFPTMTALMMMHAW
jgi:glycerol-3-phosphate dehydrogenase